MPCFIEIKNTFSALSFIALTKDNKMVIADSVEYRGMQYNLKEVTGSGVIVLRDGDCLLYTSF